MQVFLGGVLSFFFPQGFKQVGKHTRDGQKCLRTNLKVLIFAIYLTAIFL